MTTVDITHVTQYSPLIPAMKAIGRAKAGEELQIIMNDELVFKDLKEYLSEEGIGFREIYDEDKFTLQFTI